MSQGSANVRSPAKHRVFNMSGEAVPARAVVQVIDIDNSLTHDRPVLNVDKYDSDLTGPVLIVGPVGLSITATDVGHAYEFDQSRWAKYTGSEPDTGDTIGPVDDEWFMSADGSGFLVLGSRDGLSRVEKQSAGGGGSLIAKFHSFPDEEDDCYDAEDPCAWINATVVYASCSGGPAVDDQIRVYDLLGCQLSRFAQEDLIADAVAGNHLRFWAHQVKRPEVGESPVSECFGCVWAIGEVCCGELQ